MENIEKNEKTDDGNGQVHEEVNQLEVLQKAQNVLEAELKEQKNKYLYLYAEFETYKNRTNRERVEFLKFGCEPVIRELLLVSDSLERALVHTISSGAVAEGIKLVSQQLQDVLGKFGVKPIQVLGEKFNPEIHEAVAQEKLSDEAEEQQIGKIIQEHQKGYLLHGRLLRPARVVVGAK